MFNRSNCDRKSQLVGMRSDLLNQRDNNIRTTGCSVKHDNNIRTTGCSVKYEIILELQNVLLNIK